MDDPGTLMIIIGVMGVPILASVGDALIATNPDSLAGKILSGLAINLGKAKNSKEANE